MRIESNQMKLNTGRFSNVKEMGEFCLQSISGRFFSENEYVLWNKNTRDYVRNDQQGVIIFTAQNEINQYLSSVKEHKERKTEYELA